MHIEFFVIVMFNKEILIFIRCNLLYVKKKLWISIWKKKSKKILIFSLIFLKSWSGEEFTKLRPETESRNSGDHKLWNHKIQGFPVQLWKVIAPIILLKRSLRFNLIEFEYQKDNFLNVLKKVVMFSCKIHN